MSNLKLHRVTLTFDVLADDAASAISVGTSAVLWDTEWSTELESILLDRIGPYEITAVEVGATATIRRER